MSSSDLPNLWEDDVGGVWAAHRLGEAERACFAVVQREALPI